VAALRPADEAGETRVLVLPVTHSPPAQAALTGEIPAQVKERLRLDAERSWVVLSEWNEFIWPGPDFAATRQAATTIQSFTGCCPLASLPPSATASAPLPRRAERDAYPGRSSPS
jgi:hypothetical protein